MFITAGTIVVKTKAPQNRNAKFQYRVPKGYNKNRRETYRVLVILAAGITMAKPMLLAVWGGENGVMIMVFFL
jgi:uncharacterized protein YcnI